MRNSSSRHTIPIEYLRDEESGALVIDAHGVDFESIAYTLPEPIVKDLHANNDNDGEEHVEDDAGANTHGMEIQEEDGIARAGKRLKLGSKATVCEDGETYLEVFRHKFTIEFSGDLSSETSSDSDFDADDMETASVDSYHNLLGRLAERSSDPTKSIEANLPVYAGTQYPTSKDIHIYPDVFDELKYDDKDGGLRVYFTLSSLNEYAQSDTNRIEGLDDFLIQTFRLLESDATRWKTSLKLIASPPFPSVEKQCPLRLQLQLNLSVYLVTPGIFGPSMPGDKLRSVLDFIRLRDLEDEQEASQITMHAFLSSMKPAPALSVAALNAAQPRELLPSLLPFQRRSVAWLLSKEGKHINESGAIVTSSHVDHTPLFWERIRVSEDVVWYMNVLTDELQPSYPPVQEPMGGILAEEPGLGKTLESIALIMLNPSTDRNPSNSHWNEDQKTNVKEIKVSEQKNNRGIFT